MSAVAPSRPRLRPFPVVLFAVTFLVALGSLWALVLRPMRGSHAAVKAGPPELPRYGQVPAFSLAAHDGSTLTDQKLRGSVWIADFVFLRCSTSCPVMTAAMTGLAKTIEKDAPAVRFVSFSVDPDHDTVENLAAFAKENGAVAPRWLFVNGKDRPTIRKISREGFQLGLDDGGPDDTESILHSTRFVLVDRSGQIRGAYDGTDQAAVETLAHDARRLQGNPKL